MVRAFGKVKLTNPVSPLKALAPIVMASGSNTFIRLEQLEKAQFPIVCSFGNYIVDNEFKLPKAL